jgi:signal transduction histidine kinase
MNYAIIGFSELILDQNAGRINEKYVEWAGEVLGGGRQLLAMINDVLDLVMIDAGRREFSDDRVDLAIVAKACRGMVRAQAEANHVRVDCDGADAILRADRWATKQIVTNLLNNAVKFTPAGGVVTIRAESTAADGIAIVVTDTGIGLDAAALDSLCQPFTQAESSKSRKYGGAGLGLAIVRKLAAMHEGDLRVESELGKGTTVSVAFPASRVIVRPKREAVPELDLV